MSSREIPSPETAYPQGSDDEKGAVGTYSYANLAQSEHRAAFNLAGFLDLKSKAQAVAESAPAPAPVAAPKVANPDCCPSCGARLSSVELKMGNCLSCGTRAATVNPPGRQAFRVGI
jgi:hypothetical protein